MHVCYEVTPKNHCVMKNIVWIYLGYLKTFVFFHMELTTILLQPQQEVICRKRYCFKLPFGKQQEFRAAYQKACHLWETNRTPDVYGAM